MAGMFQQAGQPERAQRLNDEAMALAASAGDDVGLSDGYTMRALLADGRDDAAMLAAWQAAIEHARRAGSQQQWMLGLANLADYELSHGQFQLAYETSQRAIGLAREQGNEGTLSVGLANAGLALISLHRKEEGLALVRESMDIDERTGTMADAATNERELGLYLEQAGYLADALAAYQRSRALRDEEAVKESDHRLLEAEESLDNARRAHELALLEREGRLQEARLQQRSLEVRAWAAASAAGVLSVLVLLLFVGRQRGRNRRLAEANEALRFQAETDPLTGLTNRRHLQALCAERCTGRPLEAAYLIDLDHFRRVNQQAGHAGGDAVLAEVARRLRATVREGDIVARWGGEEFVVLSAQPSAASAHGLAARLLAAVSRAPVPYGAHALSVTASVGYVFLGEAPGAGLEGALAVADAAMYDVKRRGRDGICGVELVQPADLASVAASLEAAQADGRVVLRR
jgi:diguanylate cyclase (GGDEF)-like protein